MNTHQERTHKKEWERKREKERGRKSCWSHPLAIHRNTTSIQFAIRHYDKILYLFLWLALLKRHRLDSTPILCIATNSLSSSYMIWACPAAPRQARTTLATQRHLAHNVSKEGNNDNFWDTSTRLTLNKLSIDPERRRCGGGVGCEEDGTSSKREGGKREGRRKHLFFVDKPEVRSFSRRGGGIP